MGAPYAQGGSERSHWFRKIKQFDKLELVQLFGKHIVGEAFRLPRDGEPVPYKCSSNSSLSYSLYAYCISKCQYNQPKEPYHYQTQIEDMGLTTSFHASLLSLHREHRFTLTKRKVKRERRKEKRTKTKKPIHLRGSAFCFGGEGGMASSRTPYRFPLRHERRALTLLLVLSTTNPLRWASLWGMGSNPSMHKKEPILTDELIFYGGEGGIRTLDTLMGYTRFPIVRARPGYATSPYLVSFIGTNVIIRRDTGNVNT